MTVQDIPGYPGGNLDNLDTSHLKKARKAWIQTNGKA